MKTVFEGKVNGMVFDNVVDYNAALVEALKHGDVNASSQTKTVPDDYTEEPCCSDVCSGDQEYEGPDLFPGLDREEYYMDGMVGNATEDKQTYNEWKKYLEGNYGEVVELCERMADEDFDTYLNDLKLSALKDVEDDKNATERALESLVVEREDLKERLQILDQNIAILKNTSQLNNMFIQYYKQLIAKLESMTEPVAIETNTTEVVPQMETNIEKMEGIYRLLEEIFPGSLEMMMKRQNR